MFSELRTLLPPESASDPLKETTHVSTKSSQNIHENLTQKREKSPLLQTSKTASKLTKAKPLENSPSAKNLNKEKNESQANPLSATKPMLTKTKTVANLKTTQSTNSINKPNKEEIQKNKLSLKIDVGKEEIKAKDVPNVNSKTPKLERNPTSKGPISKTESTKTTSDKKVLVRNQTSKGPLVKPQNEEKPKIEDTKKESAKSNYNNY